MLFNFNMYAVLLPAYTSYYIESRTFSRTTVGTLSDFCRKKVGLSSDSIYKSMENQCSWLRGLITDNTISTNCQRLTSKFRSVKQLDTSIAVIHIRMKYNSAHIITSNSPKLATCSNISLDIFLFLFYNLLIVTTSCVFLLIV